MRQRFVDETFKPPLHWRRASELVQNPCLFATGRVTGDIVQTSDTLANQWIGAAVAVLAVHPALIAKVIPNAQHQDWVHSYTRKKTTQYHANYHRSPELHPGIFRFRFYRFGKWVEVVVDDYLPCDAEGEVICSRSNEVNEFWIALLEKAFAKLCGGYDQLKRESPGNAFVDISSSVPEQIMLHSPAAQDEFRQHSLYHFLQKGIRRNTLMSCCITPSSQTMRDVISEQGLIYGRSYAILNVFTIKIRMSNMRRRTAQLVKLRNPWGMVNFNGAWSVMSKEWQVVPKREMRRLGLVFEDEGEFFMSFEDLQNQFNVLMVCRQYDVPHLPVPLPLLFSRHTLHEFHSSWSILAGTAGGSLNHVTTFPSNPQYMIKVR
ncbi:Calpain-6, partial [Borealophlyctis nickersoniae]